MRAVLSGVGRALAFVGLFMVLGTLMALLLSLAGPVQGVGASVVAQGAIELLAALGAGWLLLHFVDAAPPGALGFALERRAPADFGRGMAVGCGMLAAVLLVLVLGGWVRYAPEAGTAAGVVAAWARGFVALALPATAEEALFRGYGFQALIAGLGVGPATVLASATFAAAHAANPGVGPLALGNIFVAGVLLSLAYVRTGSLWFASGLHLGWNWAMASLADLPVSGLTFLGTPLYEPVEHGPAWIAGGAFGPEGGVAGTAAFLLGLVLLRWAPRARGPVPAWRLPTAANESTGGQGE